MLENAKFKELPGASPPGPTGGLTAPPRPPAVRSAHPLKITLRHPCLDYAEPMVK